MYISYYISRSTGTYNNILNNKSLFNNLKAGHRPPANNYTSDLQHLWFQSFQSPAKQNYGVDCSQYSQS